LPTILLINPNSSERFTAVMSRVASDLLPAGARLVGRTASLGPGMLIDEPALAASAAEVVRIGRAEAAGVDAIIVAAFGDPGVPMLRGLVSVPVIGIGEAAIREAASDGRRFGIATTTPGLVRAIVAGVHGLGLADRFTGVRVSAGDPIALAADPPLQDRALAEAAASCLEVDGADVVVIGGGPLSGSAVRLSQRFPGRLVEPVPAAVRAALRRVAPG
jgi:Asp/Glu/hydantoin racemase